MRIYKNFKESNNVTLYNGDCRKLLKRLPSESVDLVVTSPPYCIGKAYEDPHDDIETFRKQHQDIFSDLYPEHMADSNWSHGDICFCQYPIGK